MDGEEAGWGTGKGGTDGVGARCSAKLVCQCASGTAPSTGLEEHSTADSPGTMSAKVVPLHKRVEKAKLGFLFVIPHNSTKAQDPEPLNLTFLGMTPHASTSKQHRVET